jgi:hypothetical protein
MASRGGELSLNLLSYESRWRDFQAAFIHLLFLRFRARHESRIIGPVQAITTNPLMPE